MPDELDYRRLAPVLASAAYARAASALVAGFEDCDEHERLMEQQKAVLVKNLVGHFQGLEIEFVQLMDAARQFAPSLVGELDSVARTKSRRSG